MGDFAMYDEIVAAHHEIHIIVESVMTFRSKSVSRLQVSSGYDLYYEIFWMLANATIVQLVCNKYLYPK